MTFIRIALLALVALFLVPVAISAALYWLRASGDWRHADRSSAGLLPPAEALPGAVVRIFSARTVSWRGIVATHSWIVIKDARCPRLSAIRLHRLGPADLGRPLRS